jgi:hypothetical protein
VKTFQRLLVKPVTRVNATIVEKKSDVGIQ